MLAYSALSLIVPVLCFRAAWIASAPARRSPRTVRVSK